MIKIFLTVRNRLAITKKCITAIQKHTTMPYQLYIYDNQTNHRIEEHFKYFASLYKDGLVTQVVFNTDASTFNAFSKASACNMFGLLHQQDPKKNECIFLLMLDNDVILMPGWDQKIVAAWKYVNKNKRNDIKVIGQTPGGIKNKKEVVTVNTELNGRIGKLGGSGLWSVRSNFFEDVGLLDLRRLVGHNKRHDQDYWLLLDKSTHGKPYILALNQKLGIHCGKITGSICNRLTRGGGTIKQKLEVIKFKKPEEQLNNLEFDEFFKMICNDKELLGDW